MQFHQHSEMVHTSLKLRTSPLSEQLSLVSNLRVQFGSCISCRGLIDRHTWRTEQPPPLSGRRVMLPWVHKLACAGPTPMLLEYLRIVSASLLQVQACDMGNDYDSRRQNKRLNKKAGREAAEKGDAKDKRQRTKGRAKVNRALLSNSEDSVAFR